MKQRTVKPTATSASHLPLSGGGQTRQLLAAGLLASFAALLGPGCSQDNPGEQLSLAASAIAAGDAQTAASHYRDAVALSPADGFMRWQLAKTLLTIRDGSGAEKQIRAATKFGIDDERTRPALAHALFLQGKYRETINLSVGGFGKLPAANILAYQVRAHIELGDLETAQALLRKATKLSRYSADVFFAQAELAFAHDDQQSALEALQKVQLVERDYPYAPARLGQIAMAKGDFASAERYFSAATELHYGPWRDHLNRGIARLQQGKQQLAREDAEALLDLVADEAEVQLFVHQAYANADDPARAQAALERVIELRPDHAPAHLALARMELQTGNTARAESLSRTALELRPAYAQARELLALLLLEQQRPNEALEIIQPALEANPDDAKLNRILADGLFEAQRYEELIALGARLEKHLDGDAFTGFSRGLQLLEDGKQDAAIGQIGPAVKIRTGDLEPYDPLALSLEPVPDPTPVARDEAPDKIAVDLVSEAAIEEPTPADTLQDEPDTLVGPAKVAASATEDPVLSQPHIVDIIPTVVSVEVLPADLPPAPPAPGTPPDTAAIEIDLPEAAPIEVDLAVETSPEDETAEDTPTFALPDTDTEQDSISVRQVENFVRDWAAAWSHQDVDAYLSHYAEDFRPAEGTSHAAWKEQRRERLLRPKSISVEVSELEVIPQDAQHVQARFVQDYRANHYRDRVTKTLDLMRAGDEWRIVRELSL